MLIRITLLAAWLFLVAPVGAQQAPRVSQQAPRMFEDLPKRHWAYAELATLQKAGLFSRYPEGIFEHVVRSLTRYEVAFSLQRELDMLAKPAKKRAGQKDALAALTPQAKDSLRRLIVEFREELVALGTEVDPVLKRLEVVSPPFKDVPPSHWAYKAVESLRLKGILRGYPGGRFNDP